MGGSPKVVVGLGNPGEEYARTRHNAGFDVVDLLAKRWGATFERTRLFQGKLADARPEGMGGVDRVRLVKPSSYMNLSGGVYARALQVFEAEPEDALVVVDDFMLPFGRLRMRPAGSAGGHNGLKSIEETLGTQAYPRLRLGIGPVPPGRDPADFVLTRYDAVQTKALPEFLGRGADAVQAWLTLGMSKAMDRVNAEPPEA